MFKLFFSDAQFAVNPLEGNQASAYSKIKQKFNLNDLILLEQIHSNKGKIINSKEMAEIPSADYLITNLSGVGLVIKTADCLPIVIHDPNKGVIANIHAGWKGAVSGILENAIADMQNHYGCDLRDLKIYFGPSAKVCCYEVSPEFIDNLKSFDQQTVVTRDGKLYFDVPKYCLLTCQKIGVAISNIDISKNVCTICNKNYYSYRRDNKQTMRQVNIVAL